MEVVVKKLWVVVVAKGIAQLTFIVGAVLGLLIFALVFE